MYYVFIYTYICITHVYIYIYTYTHTHPHLCIQVLWFLYPFESLSHFFVNHTNWHRGTQVMPFLHQKKLIMAPWCESAEFRPQFLKVEWIITRQPSNNICIYIYIGFGQSCFLLQSGHFFVSPKKNVNGITGWMMIFLLWPVSTNLSATPNSAGQRFWSRRKPRRCGHF